MAIVLVLWLWLQSVIGLLLVVLGVVVHRIIPIAILFQVEGSEMRESDRVVEVVRIFLHRILKIPLAIH